VDEPRLVLYRAGAFNLPKPLLRIGGPDLVKVVDITSDGVAENPVR
jgi:hypothetical protein